MLSSHCATCRQVKLRESGSDSIEVADNGSGVAPEDYEALTLKYHTSKLSQFSDLEVREGGVLWAVVVESIAEGDPGNSTKIRDNHCPGTHFS